MSAGGGTLGKDLRGAAPRIPVRRLAAGQAHAANRAGRLLPRLVVAVAAFVAVSDAFRFGTASLSSVQQLLPFDTPTNDPVIAALSAAGLAMLALGLFRRKRLAWWLAILGFAAGVPLQVVALGHTAGGVVAALALAFLTLDRRSYGVRSARTWSWTAWALLLAGAGTATLETLLIIVHDPLDGLPADLPDLAGALSAWLSFGDLAGPPTGPRTVLIFALAVASRLAVALALLAMLRPVPDEEPTAGVRQRVQELGRRYGRGALLPFQVAADKRWFSPAGREAFVAYGRDGRTVVAVGDPVGREDDRWLTFASFADQCRRRDWVLSVYQASGDSLDVLGGMGFQVAPIGREAIVDLESFSLSGSRRANLRHTVTRAARGGVQVRWFPDGLGADAGALGGGLEAMDRAWRESAGPDMRFTISRFSLNDLRRLPAAVALGSDGVPIALVSFRATGCDGGYVLDLVRRLPGRTPGAVESCLAEAAERFRSAGATTLSLGLAPLSGLDPSGDRVEERALATIARLVRPFYDVEGLAFFKDKFAPRWEMRYIAVPSRVHLAGLVLALARLHIGSLRGAASSQVRDAGRVPAAALRRAGALIRR